MMMMHFISNAIEKTIVTKNKLQSNPGPSSVKIDTYKTEMVDFIHTNSRNKGGIDVLLSNDAIHCMG